MLVEARSLLVRKLHINLHRRLGYVHGFANVARQFVRMFRDVGGGYLCIIMMTLCFLREFNKPIINRLSCQKGPNLSVVGTWIHGYGYVPYIA